MEITMFTLGMISMIMMMLIAVVVAGIVKVFKMNKRIVELYSHINVVERHLSQDVYRDINMIEATTSNNIERLHAQSTSYTDKRIDKLVETYFMVNEAKQNNKKVN